MKISVITVCFNAAHLLKKTIESVLEQTYHAIEYIIIDGASGDDTTEVVKAYKSDVDIFICEPDNGIYDAMNKGIKQATGDLIIFLNAGDYFVSKDVLKFYLSKMKLLEADLFFGRIVWNDPKGKDICLSDNSFVQYFRDLKQLNFPHPATLYKRSLFDKTGLFDLTYQILADYEWNVRALVVEKVKFQYINIIVTVFFVDGISNNPLTTEIVQQETLRIHEQYFKPYMLLTFIREGGKDNMINHIKNKLLTKLYNQKLNRVF